MITGTKDLLEWVDDSDCPFWKIFPYTGGTDKFIHSADDRDDLSKTVSLEKLKKTLGYLSAGRYRVQCKPENKTSKGFREVVYEHDGRALVAPIGEAHTMSMNSGMITKEEMKKEIADALATERMGQRLIAIEKENAELKKENKELSKDTLGASIGRIFEKIEPYIHTHLLKQAPTAMVAGVGYKNDTDIMNYKAPANPPINDDEALERLKNAIAAWNEKDPKNILAVIEKISDTLYDNTPLYELYVKQLLS
jgi:hypothetical protein